MTNMIRPGLVIFDCDGVLVDSEPVSNRVLVDNLRRYGLSLGLEQAMSLFVGGTMAGVAGKARAMGARLPENWIDEVYAETYDALRRGVEIIPGVPALLDFLDAEGVGFCVASNGSLEKMDITLGQTGLAPRFAGRRYSAHVLGVAKPDPGLFLHAARAEGSDPAACLVIEDSAAGAEAAQRAGMSCLGYSPDGNGEGLVRFGAKVIRSMHEVRTRLK